MKPTIADNCHLKWDDLGDIEVGRPNLGPEMPVAIYRLLQYTFRAVVAARQGDQAAVEVLRDAGWIAGREFCRARLDKGLAPAAFVAALQSQLRDLRVGILRAEHIDLQTNTMTLTVSEDLDCSGLPITGHSVCEYDEGFIAGILYEYLGVDFKVEEIDCWATGDRTCRFAVQMETAGS